MFPSGEMMQYVLWVFPAIKNDEISPTEQNQMARKWHLVGDGLKLSQTASAYAQTTQTNSQTESRDKTQDNAKYYSVSATRLLANVLETHCLVTRFSASSP